ncbi:Uncharacterised protein [Chromobacterium violaceum]|uniref:Uncharacterized protein n=1 Tax=Chromobacterium violaceum TaxID=536 RepID=A0A447T9Z7_CHRVL|nr:Uncharacterised protein [Chromobacterium violaceum]
MDGAGGLWAGLRRIRLDAVALRRRGGRAPRPAARAVLLAGQIALALLIDDKLLYLTAAELALLLSWRAACMTLGAQLALMALACAWQAQRLDESELVCNVSGSEVQAPPLERRRANCGWTRRWAAVFSC